LVDRLGQREQQSISSVERLSGIRAAPVRARDVERQTRRDCKGRRRHTPEKEPITYPHGPFRR
jgi:hypothetical protein